MLIPVILAGGVGSRLWPLSREHYPKQFIPLIDPEVSLLQSTVQRVAAIPDIAAPLVICNEEHRFMVAEQLRQLEVDSPKIMLEPVAKNTAPAVALAALKAAELDPEAKLLVLPADHLIQDNRVFRHAVAVGEGLIGNGQLVTFGVKPDRAETGYGYIRGDRDAAVDKPFVKVAEFVEKPDARTAQKYVNSGDYYWNSGMFMFTASDFLKELERFAPDILKVCRKAYGAITRDLDFHRIDAEVFSSCRSESIDFAVMEKTENAMVVPLATGWSDVGAWTAVWGVSEQSKAGNVTLGDIILEDVQDSYFRAESRMIAGVGVAGLIVVETADAVLVADKNRVQEVKAVVEALKAQGRSEVTHHKEVYRPWGSYESLVDAERFQVKRIVVNPGASLSLQLHHHRAEHWIVVKGCAAVTRGDEEFRLNEDESTYIPIGMKHRLANPGKIPLELIEVQTGSYLGEDDIVRFEDQYGRRN